ncbi:MULTISPECIES: hypothetical protein [Meridianimaribacter]|uniref:Yip1 domain-containing protein n=1 Tax=Meridianimaribacter flavus TaxID=571115 RepID=A0ABY2G8W1_9FLAO|nr:MULTISPECIES: hypothetical protein [Meridianimaribacter]TBV27598.1 hypothetical protein DMZ43_00675 [Meridianimaribacter sp. CL38]TDY14240.1 hypothetical protein A8975_0844 [Meridianimaribacter flavus]
MINKFLNAKHWQLFTLMFGIPILLQIITMISMFANIDSNGNSNQTGMLNMMKIFPIIMFLYVGLFFGWFWSIGIGLQKYIPTDINMKIKKFKIFFFIPLIYILFLLAVIGTTFYGISAGSNAVGGIIGKMLFVVIPMHLFSMFCIFYLLYFVSKTIKTTELKRIVTFGDFIGEFFMIWFFPIGIWFIQPRINKIVSLKS